MKKSILVFCTLFAVNLFSQPLISGNENEMEYQSNFSKISKAISVDVIFFDFNSFSLNIDAIRKTRIIADILIKNAKMKMNIISYSTTDETIEELSLKRGLEIKNLLIKKGIESKRLQVKNMGNNGQNDDPANRKVEFIFQ